MNYYNESKFKRFATRIKEYRIDVIPGLTLQGIKDTLVGWAIIGLIAVIKEDIQDLLVLEISFMVMYSSAAIGTLLYVLYKGLLKGQLRQELKTLVIAENTDVETQDTQAHLTVRCRRLYIYIRGLVATGGYCALNVAGIYFKPIDNTQIFGADALVFTIISILWLGEKYKWGAYVGILLAISGIALILFHDLASIDHLGGRISGSAALLSAIAFTVIFVMTSIIIRHDTPLRVTFYQSITGVAITVFIFLITLLYFMHKKDFLFPHVSFKTIANSAMIGPLYAIAVYRFLRAFLFTRPVIIAPLGYSLPIFTTIFELILGKIAFHSVNFLPASLIAFGCGLIIREDYKEDKKKSKEKSIAASKPTYSIDHHLDPSITSLLPLTPKELSKHEKGLKYIFASLKEQFNAGLLNRYEYISERHEFNKILLEYSKEISKSEIESIEILPDTVIFTFAPLHIKLETDGAARSAPFEILNFGCYEPEDEYIAYSLIENGQTIIDIGANLGWFAISFAKRFPFSLIYAFEPIPATHAVLMKNIKRNSIENCTVFNYGLSNSEEDRIFYYFKGGSAIASIENLIDHKTATQVKCKMKTLDQMATDLRLNSIDFIKCDVEGSELFVLQGAKTVLEDFKPIIFIEICEEWCQKCGYESNDIINLLKQYGYSFFEASDHKLHKVECIRSRDEGRYNYFFLHAERHAKQILKLS